MRLLTFLKQNAELSLASIIFLIFGCIAFFSSEFNGLRFSPYNAGEVHISAPAYEAAARKELLINCTLNYGAGESMCNSYGAVLDSIYLRAVASLFNRSISIDDPEFVDPLLQWFFALKKGLIVLFLLWASYCLMANAYGIPFLGALLFLHYFLMLTENVNAHAFGMFLNGEMALCFVFFFSLYLWQEKLQKASGWKTGLIAGILAPIRIPIIPFALLTLSTWRSFLVFLLTFLALVAGLFQSSYDIMSWRTQFGSMALGDTGWISHNRGPLDTILYNFLRYLPANPIIWGLLAWGVIVLGLRINRKNWYRFAGFLGLLLLGSKSRNGEYRFLIGFAGMLYVISYVGLADLFYKVKSRLPAQALTQRIVSVACFIILLSFSVYSLLDKDRGLKQTYQRAQSFFADGGTELTELDLFMKDAIRDASIVYIDKNIRLNTQKEPYLQYIDRLEVIDLFNRGENFQNGATILSLCYSRQDAGKLGVSSESPIFDVMESQCSSNQYADIDRIFRPHTSRYYAVRNSLRVIKFTVDRRSLLFPIHVDSNPLTLDAASFKINGFAIQEWESQVTNMPPIDNRNFSLQKDFLMTKGKYVVRPIVNSRYREKGSVLQFYVNDVLSGTCALDTKTKLNVPSAVPQFLADLYGVWRSKYFPVDCVLEFRQDDEGYVSLEFKIESDEPLGKLRFYKFVLEQTHAENLMKDAQQPAS